MDSQLPEVLFTFSGAWVTTGGWIGGAFSAESDKAGTPDGTKSARSGGLSFPTNGVAWYRVIFYKIQPLK